MSAPPQQDVTVLQTSPIRRAAATLAWALVAAAGLAAIVGWQTPLMVGLLGAGATVWRATAVTGAISRLRVIATGSILTASVLVSPWTDWRMVTVGGICAALVLYPALHMAERRGEEDTRSAQVRRLVRGLVIGLTIALSGLGLLGAFERIQASFAIRYGQPVEVSVGRQCNYFPAEGMPCTEATWMIDGRTYTGTLFVGSRELPAHVRDVYAYPGDNRAFSVRHESAGIDGMEIVGFVPPWIAIAGLIMLVVVALPARVRGRIPWVGRVG